jgi:Restriction Enzyme Adenine Methylase Associated
MAKRVPLVCQHLENISRDVLKNHQDIIRNYVRGRHGVYALYKGDRLYYVGLASNLKMRLGSHGRNQHGQQWDRFSVYLTIGDRTLRELEALLLRIVKPKGNSQKGKFAKSEDLKRRFGRDMREYYRGEVSSLLGRPIKASKAKIKPIPKGKIGNTVKVLRGRALRLRRVYKGKLYKARLRADGKVTLNRVVYPSPSAAGKAVCGHALNGWQFWNCERAPGDWVKLAKLRR